MLLKSRRELQRDHFAPRDTDDFGAQRGITDAGVGLHVVARNNGVGIGDERVERFARPTSRRNFSVIANTRNPSLLPAFLPVMPLRGSGLIGCRRVSRMAGAAGVIEGLFPPPVRLRWCGAERLAFARATMMHMAARRKPKWRVRKAGTDAEPSSARPFVKLLVL